MSESFNVFDRASNRVLRRRVNRRRMLQASALAGVGAAGFALVGCGDDDDDEAATAQAEETAAEETPAAETPTKAEEGFAAATPSAVPPKSSKDTLVAAVGALPLGADSETSHGNPATWEAIGQANDGLLKLGWRKYPFDKPAEAIGTDYVSFSSEDIQPWYLQSWENSEDFSSTTFHIRPGVLSFNGNEFTSADMQYKIDRTYGLEAIGLFFTGYLNMDVNNPIEVIDKYTFKLNSTAPQFLMVPTQANNYWGVLDSTEAKKSATEDDPWAVQWAQTNNQSFGGYGITEFEPGNQVVFTANPNYFRGEPPLKKVIYKEVPSGSNRLAAIQRGEADIVYGLPAELYIQARDEQIEKPYAAIINYIVHGFMNSQLDPFKDPRTRQAFNWATPRQDIVDSAFGGLGTPWLGVMSSIYPGADASSVPWGAQADYTTAKQLLDAAGQGDGFDVTMDIDSSVDFYERIAVLMQDALSNIDVDMGINPQANAQYSAETTSKQKTFGLWQDVYIEPDPIYNILVPYGYGQRPGSSVNNYGLLDDPELNALLDKGKLATTLDERIAIAKDAQKRAADLAGYLWLVEPYYTNVQKSNLQGYRIHTTVQTYYNDMYFT